MPPAHVPESVWHLATLGSTPVSHEGILQLIAQVRGFYSQGVKITVCDLPLPQLEPPRPQVVETEVDRYRQMTGSLKNVKRHMFVITRWLELSPRAPLKSHMTWCLFSLTVVRRKGSITPL